MHECIATWLTQDPDEMLQDDSKFPGITDDEETMHDAEEVAGDEPTNKQEEQETEDDDETELAPAESDCDRDPWYDSDDALSDEERSIWPSDAEPDCVGYQTLQVDEPDSEPIAEPDSQQPDSEPEIDESVKRRRLDL